MASSYVTGRPFYPEPNPLGPPVDGIRRSCGRMSPDNPRCQEGSDHERVSRTACLASSRLYGRGEGFVFAVHGEQRPDTVRSLCRGVGMTGGRAQYDIVFLSGSFSLGLPECILRRVQ